MSSKVKVTEQKTFVERHFWIDFDVLFVVLQIWSKWGQKVKRSKVMVMIWGIYPQRLSPSSSI